MRRPTRSGFTLVETIVAIAVLAIALGVSGIALVGLVIEGSPSSSVRQARSEALASGRRVVQWPDSTIGEPWLLLPDGRVVGVVPGREAP